MIYDASVTELLGSVEPLPKKKKIKGPPRKKKEVNDSNSRSIPYQIPNESKRLIVKKPPKKVNLKPLKPSDLKMTKEMRQSLHDGLPKNY